MPGLLRNAFMLLMLWSLAGVALAHEGGGHVGGFSSGFMHPLLGWDHVLAMVAVGLWGAFLGGGGSRAWGGHFGVVRGCGCCRLCFPS